MSCLEFIGWIQEQDAKKSREDQERAAAKAAREAKKAEKMRQAPGLRDLILVRLWGAV